MRDFFLFVSFISNGPMYTLITPEDIFVSLVDIARISEIGNKRYTREVVP